MKIYYQIEELKAKDIENNEVVKSWWKRINASENTTKHYARGLTYFLRFIREKNLPLGDTPEDLIEYARKRIREDVLKWRDEIEGILADYKDWLKNKPKILKGGEHLQMKLAPKTIHDYIAAVKSFYNAFNIDVPKNKGKGNIVKPLVENNRRLTKEMLKEVLKYADVRERAIILTMVASGIGDSEILNLKVGDFIRGRGYNPQRIGNISSWIIEERKRCENEIKNGNLDYGITTLEIRRKKTQIDYITFLTPEATMAILDYLAWRNRESGYAERHKGIGKIREEKRKVRSPDDYLFIRKYIDDWYLPPEIIEKLRPARIETTKEKSKATKAIIEKVKKKREELALKEYADEVRKLDRKGLMAMFRDLAKKSGLNTKFGVFQVLRGHNLRKLFYTLLRNEGVDSFIIEYWMGHKIPAEQETYFQSIPEKLKRIYKKHLYAITIKDVETKVLESEEYKELKGKIEIYEEALKKRNEEIEKLKEEIEKLKRKEEKREPLDELMSKLMSDPEVQSLIKKKIKELGLI